MKVKYVVYFIVSFLIVYLFYLITVVLQKKKMEKFKTSNQIMFFVKRYKLDINKINMTKFTNLLGLSNAFIVSTAFMTTFLVDNFILQLLAGFLVLLPLMIIIYSLIGKYYVRKGCVLK